MLVALALSALARLAMMCDFDRLRTKLRAEYEPLVIMMLNKDRRGADQQELIKEIIDAVGTYQGRLRALIGYC